jgi:hypothetical protein
MEDPIPLPTEERRIRPQQPLDEVSVGEYACIAFYYFFLGGSGEDGTEPNPGALCYADLQCGTNITGRNQGGGLTDCE